MRLRAALSDGELRVGTGPLARRDCGNAMAPMLDLFDALATGNGEVVLNAGPGRILTVSLDDPAEDGRG